MKKIFLLIFLTFLTNNLLAFKTFEITKSGFLSENNNTYLKKELSIIKKELQIKNTLLIKSFNEIKKMNKKIEKLSKEIISIKKKIVDDEIEYKGDYYKNLSLKKHRISKKNKINTFELDFSKITK